MLDDPHKGWYRPRRLPHADIRRLIQSITYRLADALPQAVMASVQARIADGPSEHQQRQLRRLVEEHLDRGYGSCLLRQDAVARRIWEQWMQHHGKRYELLAWVIMPNHVHIMIRPYAGHTLPKIVGDWKRWSARRINLDCRRQGPLWQSQYWDRYIRDALHYQRVLRYIEQNPVTAGLVTAAKDWPWSSANPRHAKA